MSETESSKNSMISRWSRKKTRSPRVCTVCRGRKVRCDMMTRGAPCTNCRFNEVECVVGESVRGSRKSTIGQLEENQVCSFSATQENKPTKSLYPRFPDSGAMSKGLNFPEIRFIEYKHYPSHGSNYRCSPGKSRV